VLIIGMVLGKFARFKVDEAIGDDPGIVDRLARGCSARTASAGDTGDAARSRRQEGASSRPSNLASTNFK
jgi:hypothetical protein